MTLTVSSTFLHHIVIRNGYWVETQGGLRGSDTETKWSNSGLWLKNFKLKNSCYSGSWISSGPVVLVDLEGVLFGDWTRSLKTFRWTDTLTWLSSECDCQLRVFSTRRETLLPTQVTSVFSFFYLGFLKLRSLLEHEQGVLNTPRPPLVRVAYFCQSRKVEDSCNRWTRKEGLPVSRKV